MKLKFVTISPVSIALGHIDLGHQHKHLMALCSVINNT